MKYVVRNAVKNDLPKILELYRDNYFEPQECIDENAVKIFDGIVYSPDKYLLLCEADSEIVSCVTLNINESLAYSSSSYAFAEHLCVRDTRHSLEAAELLIAKVKEISASYGCYKISFINEKENIHINSLLLQQGFVTKGNCVKIMC